MSHKKYLAALFAVTVLLSSGVVSLAHAESGKSDDQKKSWGFRRDDDRRQKMGTFGKITAINGSNLTVSGLVGKKMMNNGSTTEASGTTYNVNGGSAVVFKDRATSTISALTVGEVVLIEGSVSGNSITATKIFAGMGRSGMMNPKKDDFKMMGNGSPVIGGKVTAINGSVVSMTNDNGTTTYAVNTSGAKINKEGKVATLADIAVGDNLIVQGKINDTSVTATLISDRGTKAPEPKGDNKGTVLKGGFFGRFGGLFHMFGF